MRIGYARASTQDQSLDIQIEQLTQAGCSPVRGEKVSGKSREGRSELEAVLQFIREDDELVVTKLDRLGRSTRDVLNIVHELDAKGASLRVLEPEITTSGPLGRMVVTTLGLVAELERGFIRERQRAGIEAAKKRGVYKGRKRCVEPCEVRRLLAAGERPSELARRLSVSRMTIHRAAREKQDEPKLG